MADRTLASNNGAFTLLEVLVAILILTVGLLGMLQSINLAIETNMRNELRNQGVEVIEDLLSQKKTLTFENITATGEKSLLIPRSVRRGFINYSISMKIDTISDNAKRINFGARWIHKRVKYEHVVSSIVSRPFSK